MRVELNSDRETERGKLRKITSFLPFVRAGDLMAGWLTLMLWANHYSRVEIANFLVVHWQWFTAQHCTCSVRISNRARTCYSAVGSKNTIITPVIIVILVIVVIATGNSLRPPISLFPSFYFTSVIIFHAYNSLSDKHTRATNIGKHRSNLVGRTKGKRFGTQDPGSLTRIRYFYLLISLIGPLRYWG